jgi:hypothetical protein
MRIPDGPNGRPCVSVSQLRTYGAPGFDLDNFESARGCPRQYKARYVTKEAKRDDAGVLRYGTVIHKAFEVAEAETMSPEDALERVWDPMLGQEWFAEAVEDLRKYMERPAGVMGNYSVIASEAHLVAPLFTHEKYGPIDFQGYVDEVSLDARDPYLLHLRDFKTNRQPPSVMDVKRDAQGKGYTWLTLQNLDQLMPGSDPDRVRVVFHLDAIKWAELPPVYFDAHDLDEWHAWMVAVVRAILDDEEAKPHVNPGCASCPVRDTCPAFQALPNGAADLLAVKPDDRDRLVAWRDRANAMRLLLKHAVDEADGRFVDDAKQLGGLTAGGYRWEPETVWETHVDTRGLHDLLGERFYDAVSPTKAALTRITAGDPALQDAALALFRSVPAGTTIKRKKDQG